MTARLILFRRMISRDRKMSKLTLPTRMTRQSSQRRRKTPLRMVKSKKEVVKRTRHKMKRRRNQCRW